MSAARTHTPDPFAVVISPGLWRGFDIAVEPPVSTHPLRHFRTHTDALAAAEAIASAEGWPIRDRTSAGQSSVRAAR
jgi:hypothetical protein